MMNGSETRGQQIKSQRARELDELRSRGVAKARRAKLKDFSAPLQTAEEAKEFLLACREHQQRRTTFAMPEMPSSMNAVDYNSFLMEQSRRQRELKMRRREAEQLLHGFRGFYKESFGSWASPRSKKGQRASFGFGYTESLGDTDDDSRRQSSMPRLEQNWSEGEERDDSSQYAERLPRNPLDPHCTDFLHNTRHYDGTQYPRTAQDMDVSDAVSLFSYDGRSRGEDRSVRSSHFRDPSADFQDPRGYPSDKIDSDAVFDERNGVSDNGKYTEERDPAAQSPDRTSCSYGPKFDREAVLHGENGVDKCIDENESKKTSTPYKAKHLSLQIDTDLEKEDRINITASAERLRQARSTDSRGEGIDDVVKEENRPSPPIDYEKELPNLDLTESTSRDEILYQEQEVAPRRETIWRNFISDEPGAKFPPEAGRYHLYASYACPGSHRALIVRALKGLEDVISVTIVHPTWRHTNPNDPRDKHRGWIFGDPNGKPFHNTMGRGGPFPPAYADNDPDPVLNAYSVRNLYEHAEDTSGKYTIPLLWDTKLNTIVNNESSDISYMLNSCFNKFAENPVLDLYTEDDEDGLDRLNEVSKWLYPMMIHGVYRCGFAKTQRAYDQAIEELTEAFDAADELLQHQRYLTGDTLTDADIRFFVTLLRFDEVYAFYFRANTRLVMMTPSLLNFCREIYQMPGVAETCQMDQIKAHFFGSHAEWNKYSVVPRGLGFMGYLNKPHDRDKLTGYGHI